MRFYRDKTTGEVMDYDAARQLCGAPAFFYDRFEEIKGAELTRVQIEHVIATHEPADSYKYMLLDRLRTDCGYYLGNGNRNPRNLWGGSIQAHIKAMKTLYNSFPREDRPQWLTMDQIQELAKQMESEPTGKAEGSEAPAVGTLCERGD